MGDVWDADCILLLAYRRDKEAEEVAETAEDKAIEDAVDEESSEDEDEDEEGLSGHCPMM
jgi:hypothetical protein